MSNVGVKVGMTLLFGGGDLSFVNRSGKRRGTLYPHNNVPSLNVDDV